jgi:hypothetical protein
MAFTCQRIQSWGKRNTRMNERLESFDSSLHVYIHIWGVFFFARGHAEDRVAFA